MLQATIEPSLSYILVPKAIYQKVKLLNWNKFLATKHQLEELIVPDLISYQYVRGQECSAIASLFQNVTITIGKAVFYIPPASFLKDFTYNYYGVKEPHCRIMIALGKEGGMSLGNVFLENYPMTYTPSTKSFLL